MSTRKKVSIILCVVFVLAYTLLTLLVNYLNSAYHPGIKSESFAPVKVIKASDEKDIFVTVYPSGIMPHKGSNLFHEVNLNCIKKGWLINQYNGRCRLIFDVKDADMEDYALFTDRNHYYVAEIIPTNRLLITDITARHAEEATDPFVEGYIKDFSSCCIAKEISNYRTPRVTTVKLIAVNGGFILLVAGVNVIINRVSKRKEDRG